MKRTTRASLAALGALLVAACSGAEGEPPGTESTNRSLLNQEIVGGPSTPVTGDPGLSGQASLNSIPMLGHNFGSADAPLKLIEFSDFGCGYCRRFHEESFGPLHTEFVETGQIEWKFMPFITGMFENSLAVTETAECTLEQGAELFERFSDRLWQRQAEWKGSGEPAAVARGWVRELGGDVERLDSCLAEDRRLPRVAAHTSLAQQLGVRGTPTFWLVGWGPLQGALPLEAFQGILSTVLAEIEMARDSAAAADSVAAD